MRGIVSVEIAPKMPREYQEWVETINGTNFQVEKLCLRRLDGLVDRMMLRRSLRTLAMRGVKRVAVPADSYIKRQIERYNMTEISHTPLLRCLAPQIIDYLLQRRMDTAVLLYAERLDDEVLAAVHHAARSYNTVMLELGRWSEMVRDQIIDLYGVSALLGIVPIPAKKTVALWFDCPPVQMCRRMERMISVALCEQADMADYNDVHLCQLPEHVPQDTDREGIISAIVSDNASRAATLKIDCLVKK